MHEAIYQVLQERFQFSEFREGQAEIITALLKGQDTLAILPTGKGKSLCYQLPGYLLNGIVVIVSPLISLMEDQVLQLQKFGEKQVVALTGDLSRREKEWVLEHLSDYRFLFLSPEMLLQDRVLNHLQQVDIGLFVVDEAHCVSMWGNDFRPEYRYIGQALERLQRPLLLGLTATATPKVTEDIRNLLFPEECYLQQQSVERSNIRYFVECLEDKRERLEELLAQVASPGIIYCGTRKMVELLYQELRSKYSVGYYHGGLDSGQRRQLQEQFTHGKLDWLIATNAFGMGIDKGDIRTVIHYDLPDSLENYLQEVGRAGRDGLSSQGILLYAKGDEGLHHFFQQSLKEERKVFEQLMVIDNQKQPATFSELQEKWYQEVTSFGSKEKLLRRLTVNEAEKQQQLQLMLAYIHETGCRRAFLLQHFGEGLSEHPEECCDYHKASLLLKQHTTNKLTGSLSWQEVLLKLFKEKNKVPF